MLPGDALFTGHVNRMQYRFIEGSELRLTMIIGKCMVYFRMLLPLEMIDWIRPAVLDLKKIS